MKTLKKILGLGLILSMTVACFTGCGDGKKNVGGTSKTDIQIAYWNSGYGTEWLDAMVEAFNEAHPEYHAYYKATADDATIMGTLGKKDVDTVDIYMGLNSYDTTYLEPLDSLYETVCEDDSKKLIEKFNEEYLALTKNADGHYYGIPFAGGIMGIIYNKDLFEQAGITQVPRTTDELAAVCDELYNNDIPSTVHFTSASGGYWEFITEAWIAQYCGMDYYMNNLYACVDEEGNSPSKDVLMNKEDGRYQVLSAYEKFITPDYVLAGSNTNDHVTSQTMFVNGKAAMMANGSWLTNEMSMNENMDSFAWMRTPILSSVKEKLQSVTSERALRELVSAIDSVTDGEKQASDFEKDGGYDIAGNVISKEDWDYIADARNALSISYSAQPCLIPNYSNAKEGAMKFLEFMYSDKGYKIYTDTLHTILPMSMSEGEVDSSDWKPLEQQLVTFYDNASYFVSSNNSKRHDIYINGGASLFPGRTNFVNYFCNKNAADRMTADEAWEFMMKTVEDNYEKSWLLNIK